MNSLEDFFFAANRVKLPDIVAGHILRFTKFSLLNLSF